MKRIKTTLVAVLCAGTLALAGCPAKKPATTPRPAVKKWSIRCKLPASALQSIDEVKNALDLPGSTRGKLLELLKNGCQGWPRYISSLLESRLSYFLDRRYRRNLKEKPIPEQPAFLRDMTRLCPAFGKVPRLSSKSRRADVKRFFGETWSQCGFANLGVFSRAEYDRSGTVAMCAAIMHHVLSNGGMRADRARALSRLLLTDHQLLRYISSWKTRLPVTRSQTKYQLVPALRITDKQVFFRLMPQAKVVKGRVDVDMKRDGPEGYFINPLYSHVSVYVGMQQRRHGMSFIGQATIVAQADIGYRLLMEVIYTARQAGIKQFQLGARHATLRVAVIPIVMPLYLGRKSPFSKRPGITITAKTYRLKMSPTAQPKVFAKAGAGDALRELAAYLKGQQAKLKRAAGSPRTWGSIRIQATEGTTLQELITVLDAVREKPGSTGVGCQFRFDQKQNKWTLPPTVHRACLYPFPILSPPPDPSGKPRKPHRP